MNGANKICGRQPLYMVCLSRPYPFKFFKGCFPQILLGPFLNTLSHMEVHLVCDYDTQRLVAATKLIE